MKLRNQFYALIVLLVALVVIAGCAVYLLIYSNYLERQIELYYEANSNLQQLVIDKHARVGEMRIEMSQAKFDSIKACDQRMWSFQRDLEVKMEKAYGEGVKAGVCSYAEEVGEQCTL